MAERSMARMYLLIASLLGGLAVAAGAFAAHGLAPLLDTAALATFQTAVRYQMYHALALLAIALLLMLGDPALPPQEPKRLHRIGLQLSGGAFCLGVLLFCGSLYGLSLGSGLGWNPQFWGPITPIGGGLLLLGWATLAITAWR